MKQYHSIFPPSASLVCSLILMLAACTHDALDELPSVDTDNDAHPLTITVSDGGMYAAGQTRAQEQGYLTVFTEGDRIGLYVENNGTLEVKNLCLTLRSGKWTLPAGTSQLLYSPDKSFHAYYPYRDDNYMNNKVSLGNEDFFKPIVDIWDVNTDQSTYAKYTASDLMTARGVYSNHTLSFAMEHRMALLIFRFPTTKYNYTETMDRKEIPKSYYRYTVLGDPLFLQEDPSTGRFLLGPGGINHPSFNIEYYSGGQIKVFVIETASLKLQPGRYTIIPVDGGAVTEETRALQEGDYYMKDGGILPQEDVTGTMSDKDKENCLGVVFWVGEKKGESDGTTYHWARYESKRGDLLLMHDHPGCTHGIVVALTDAAADKKLWSSTSTDAIYQWLSSYAATGQKAEKELLLVSSINYGYNLSRRLQWYRDYGGQHTEAYDAIEDFAKANHTPAGCSGWYFPSDCEMTIMARGTLNTHDDHNMTAILNAQFDKAGGDRFKIDDYYWSSSDSGTNSYCIIFSKNQRLVHSQRSEHYVRAVLAF